MASSLEQLVSLGFHKQAALQTALVAADCWTLPYDSGGPLLITPRMSNNAGKPGTGTPYSTVVYKESLITTKSITAKLSSEWAAMCAVFGIGNFTKSASGDGFKYAAAIDTGFAALEADLPVVTVVESVRQGASAIYDYAAIGMALNRFSINLKSGVGQDTCMCTMDWMGCGKYARPSTISHPALETVHEFNIGQATALTINGVNYLTSGLLVSLDFEHNNNIDESGNYIIGGGTQEGYNIMGRMRKGGIPSTTLRMRVEMPVGAAELDALLDGTIGTGSVVITGDAMGASYHKLELSFKQIQYTTHVPASGDNNLLVVDIDVDLQRHTSNGVLGFDAYCAQDEIGTAAS